jgi:hypothetical protein
MPQYKIHSINHDGHVSAPAEIFECAEELEALVKLALAVNGKAAELWSGDRLIARFPGDE